jgi:RecB family endonuclease NucS
MSDPGAIPTKTAALQIYVERGDLEASNHAQKELGASKQELTKFARMMISEKTREDNLEANLSVVGNAIKRNLTLIGRQYETTVGPIDLLAIDKTDNRYVVIELKKGRSADRVFGQLSRYMGWVRANLADGAPVVGVIVGSKIDEKLRAARAAHDTAVHLVRYRSQISAQLDD